MKEHEISLSIRYVNSYGNAFRRRSEGRMRNAAYKKTRYDGKTATGVLRKEEANGEGEDGGDGGRGKRIKRDR